MAARGRSARDKGMAAEREVARILTDQLGRDGIRRIYLSGMKGEGDIEGIAVHCEVKRQETLRLRKWIADERPKCGAGTPLAVIHRGNRQEWLVTMPLTDWIELMREAL